MTKREIASLAIKLMGVFIFLKTLAYVPISLWSLSSSRQVGYTEGAGKILLAVSMVLLAVVPVVFAVLIIVFSDKVAAPLIKEQDDVTIELTGSVQKEDILVGVFTCIGLYLIVSAFPGLIIYLSQFFTFRKVDSAHVTYTSGGVYQLSRLIVPVVQLALGIWLFAGSKGIVKLWKKIRS